jgi:phage terminase large subunit
VTGIAERRQVRLEDILDPTPRQAEATLTADAHDFTLYGGARGGGKSRWIRYYLARFLIRTYAQTRLRNVRVGLFCEDYPALRDRHISKLETEMPAWLGFWHDSAKEFRLDAGLGGGVIAFRNLDDPSKYQSAEFAAIGVDELTKNAEVGLLHTLRGSLRWPGLDHTPFIAGTNPGGPGHAWVKQLWIDRAFPEELLPIAHRFAFVRALATDNPHNGRVYLQTLETLPEALRKAWLEGSWDAFEGQYFAEWRHELHTCQPFVPPEYWEVEAGMDWGYAPHPAAVVWAAFDPFGRPWAYKELVIGETAPRRLAEMIAERCTTEVERRMIIRGDTQMWTPQPDRGVSIAQEMNDRWAELGLGIVLVQANKDRLNGWMRLHQHLDPRRPNPAAPGTPAPWLRVCTADPSRGLGCPILIGSLPALQHDKKGTGDAAKGGPDHAPDALRYLLMGRPPLSEIPLEDIEAPQPHQRIAAHVANRMARALAAHNRGEDDDVLPTDDHPLLEVLEGGLPTTADLFES